MTPVHVQQQWNDYRTRLFRFVRSRVLDDHMAEDVVHDSLVKAWEHRDSLKDDDAIIPWLFRITVNTLRDAYRARKPNDSAIDVEELSDALPDQEMDSSASVHQQFAYCLRVLIDGLTPDNRDTIVRSEINGEPMRLIAKDLGLSVSAVKSRVQRSRVQLKQSLLACCKIELNQHGQVVNADELDCACSPDDSLTQ